jgi:hypothetical protein
MQSHFPYLKYTSLLKLILKYNSPIFIQSTLEDDLSSFQPTIVIFRLLKFYLNLNSTEKGAMLFLLPLHHFFNLI